jgi:hypothetical protein
MLGNARRYQPLFDALELFSIWKNLRQALTVCQFDRLDEPGTVGWIGAGAPPGTRGLLAYCQQ